MDVACFCGCRFSCAGDLGTCPGCGENVSLSRVSDAEEKQMRAELDLLLTRAGDAGRGQRVHLRTTGRSVDRPSRRFETQID
jgi:hypothetical protein